MIRLASAVPSRCAVLLVAGIVLAGCSGDADGDDGGATEETTAVGVPTRWYDAVDEALAETPDVGSTAQMDTQTDCPLVDGDLRVGGADMEQNYAGVVRLGGEVPAVVCSFYPPVPVDLIVAQAEDEAVYRELVDSSGAIRQPGNVQTEQELEVGDRTVLVVRTEYPTNPAAGVDYRAHVFDDEARGRVTLEVADGDDRDPDYDEQAIAEDLVALLGG